MARSTTGPQIACEITADRVIAARAGPDGSLALHSVRRLPTGAISPGLSGHNLPNNGAALSAVAEALEDVSAGIRSRDLVAVMPDAAVRVLLLDFDSLPESRAEAEPIIRFRLKKSLPFDVENAGLSYQPQRSNGTLRVIAAISPRSVIDEYESIFREAGYHPGVVIPSTLATLGLIAGERPTMLIKIDLNTTSVAIVDRGELVLVRTLDHPSRTEISSEQLASNIHPSLVFFEDTYNSRIESLLITGTAADVQLAPALQSETGLSVKELAGVAGSFGEGRGEKVSGASLTAVAGALA